MHDCSRTHAFRGRFEGTTHRCCFSIASAHEAGVAQTHYKVDTSVEITRMQNSRFSESTPRDNGVNGVESEFLHFAVPFLAFA